MSVIVFLGTQAFSFGQPTGVLDMEDANLRQKLLNTPFGQKFQPVEAEEKKVPEIVPGEMEDTGPQYIVQRVPIRKWFDVYVDSQFFYTSNVFQQEEPTTGDEAEDSNILVSTAQFAVAPDAFEVGGGQLSPRLGYRHQWFNYSLHDTFGGLNSLDFDSQTVFTDLSYTFDQNWTASLGFEWTRLLGHEPPTDDYAEFYKEYLPYWSIQRRFPISENMQASFSYEGSYHVTEVDRVSAAEGYVHRNDRQDHAFTLQYTYMPIERFIVQPFIRFQVTDYTQPTSSSRIDHTYMGGMTLSYYFTDWLGSRAFFNYTNRQSDDTTVADYEKWDGGGGLSVFIKF